MPDTREATQKYVFQPALWQIYYRESQNIVQNKWATRGRFLSFPWKRFMILTYILETTRLLIATYSFMTEGHIFKHDIFMEMLSRNNICDKYIVLAVIGLPISSAYFNYIIYFRSKKADNSLGQPENYLFTSQLFYDLTVRNGDQLLHKNGKLWRRLLGGLKGRQFWYPTAILSFWKLYATIWKNGSGASSKSRKFNAKLSHFPAATLKTRSRALLMQIFSELFHTFILFTIFCIGVLGTLYYINILLHIDNVHFLHILPAILEMTVIGCEIWNCAAILLLLTFLLRIIAFVSCQCFIELRSSLNSTLKSIYRSIPKRQECPLLVQAKLAFKLTRFRAQHIALICNIIQTNSYFFSPVIFGFILGNTPFNAYFIAFFYRNASMLHIDTIVVLAFLGVYIAGALIASSTVAFTCDQLHGFAPQLVSIQQRLSGVNSIHAKVKTLLHYELVHSNNKISFTVGPLGPITRNTIFNFTFIYLGYILFSLNFIYSKH